MGERDEVESPMERRDAIIEGVTILLGLIAFVATILVLLWGWA